MRFIGITGGVGSGKSTVLDEAVRLTGAPYIKADDLVKEMYGVGEPLHKKMRKLFDSEDIWNEDTSVDMKKLSAVIYSDDEKRRRLNDLVHPAVKTEIKKIAEECRGRKDEYLFLEAALLIEEKYDEICDELWYVYADDKTRRERLKRTRGYSDEKIDSIMKAQLSDKVFREKCSVVIDNSTDQAHASEQIRDILGLDGESAPADTETAADKMEANMDLSEKELVFGLDIGTRNVVGTVGYKDDDEKFVAVDMYSVQHSTRAMLDGQIHDIEKVGRTIAQVKEKLEEDLGITLSDVCIAAAGRVLKTVTTTVEYEFDEEVVVTGEDVHTLDLLGVERAQDILRETNDTRYKFYVVGYTVVKYYLNDELMSNLVGHKAEKITEDVIVTFLPWDVVDGLYSAVAIAGLSVANLTLEPIAAINVAIPENYRMLNIALVDVGAGTSDICITRDGSIIAYGMIPNAGDEITELIVQHYLVDFAMAEKIKLDSTSKDEIEFEDIMSITHTVPAKEVWELIAPTVERIAKEVAAKIIELNGDTTVSACFVVGGGGKVHGFTENLSRELNIIQERVALRGEAVLKNVIFLNKDVEKDPLIVTPIGICLNYYEQKNSFIMVRFNGERIKLYDNNHLTIVDAAIAADFPDEYLFPRRGKPINFFVNGVARMVRGTVGESAVVKMNGVEVSINTPLEPNSEIEIEKSTVGEDAVYTIEKLHEFNEAVISFDVNHKTVTCPKFVEVNGEIVTAGYALKDGDDVTVRNYYTVRQLAEFMDVELDPDAEIIVNNRVEDLDTEVYENFSVEFSVLSFRTTEADLETPFPDDETSASGSEADGEEMNASDGLKDDEIDPEYASRDAIDPEYANEDAAAIEGSEDAPNAAEESEYAAGAALMVPESDEARDEDSEGVLPEEDNIPYSSSIRVYVNDEPLTLKGRSEYSFVDIFDFIDFDLSDSRGRSIITTLNGEKAVYTRTLFDGDRLVIKWAEKEGVM